MILSDNQCVFNDKVADMKQKLHGTLRLGLRRSWDVPRFAISLRHVRQIYRRTTNRTGNVESIAIRGVYRDNRASTSNISEGGYGWSRSTGPPWPKFHRTWRSKDQFLYTVYCLFFSLSSRAYFCTPGGSSRWDVFHSCDARTRGRASITYVCM